MSPSKEFLELLAEHKKLEDKMKQLAWQIASKRIKELLRGKGGIYEFDEKDEALDLLIRPHWELDEKSPTEAIIDGDTERVVKMLNEIKHSFPV